jgi:hypothetical protein
MQSNIKLTLINEIAILLVQYYVSWNLFKTEHCCDNFEKSPIAHKVFGECFNGLKKEMKGEI